jgi:hypothetical protein
MMMGEEKRESVGLRMGVENRRKNQIIRVHIESLLEVTDARMRVSMIESASGMCWKQPK